MLDARFSQRSRVIYLLRRNAVWSAENQQTFRRNMSTPSSGLKNKPSKKPTCVKLVSFSFLLGVLFFHPEVGGDMFLRIIGWFPTHYAALAATCLMMVSCLVYSSTLRWRRHVLPKRRSIFNTLHGVSRMKLFAICVMLFACLVYSSTLKMEATYSSETSVDFQHSTRS
jgi:hypothetical protein